MLTAGGITYPLYLHMRLGYVIFDALAPERHIEAITCAIVLGAFVLAYAVWRFAETPVHHLLKARMNAAAEAVGWSPRLRASDPKIAAF